MPWQQTMMDFSMVIIFALLQIAEVQTQTYLEWKEVHPPQLPKDAVPVFDRKSKQTFYVARLEDCTPCFYDSAKKSCSVSTFHGEFNLGHTVQNRKISFLLNKDNFEIFEWKKSSFGEVPPLPVETCNGYFIARNDFGLGYMTDNSLITIGAKNQDTTENEVLTLNHDIKGQHLTITEYQIGNAKASENIAVLKHFTASNKNCDPAKQQVKLDQGIDKTVSFLKTRTHTFGGTGETSVSGKVPLIISIGGKLGLKYDYSRLNSKTTSTVEKSLHSVSMEVQVPANHACSIVINSNTFTADVPFTGQLTRVYNNGEARRTLVDGIYSHQEVAEIQALVNPCTPLVDKKRC
ncbi:ETX/MTX2 family pore-forming toxin [Vibrio harveyi]